MTALGVGLALSLAAACAVDVSLGRHDKPSPIGGSGGGGPPQNEPNATGGFDGGEPCVPGLYDDHDQDGFSIADGDCNDCVAAIGPSSIEALEPAGADEDCDGEIDEIDAACDGGLMLADKDPYAAAQAIELCKMASGPDDWGLVEARWVLPDGELPTDETLEDYHLGHGIIDDFGPAISPRRGVRMLALSSGTARRPKDADHESAVGFDKSYGSDHPEGFPKESSECGAVTGEPRDGVGLEVVMRAPNNARGIAFDFDFYTYEWPKFVCTESNDFFVALMDPPPPGSIDGNISFDSQGNPVSVNAAFLEVCACAGPGPCTAGGKLFECMLGDGELLGTGYGADTEGEPHAATSWLVTEAPVAPGETIRIRLSVYDSTDGTYDSLTLVDNVRWLAISGGLGTTRVPE